MSTIRDVAAKAGASIASVSRILNNDPTYKTTAETRERILTAARELNYALPQSAKKRPDINIGCINRLTVERTKDSYYASILDGIQSYLARQNIRLGFIESQFDVANKETLDTLLRPNTKGLILMDNLGEDIVDYILSKVKCVVGIDTGLRQIDNVRYNRFEAGCQAMQHLIDNGHRKIAYIGSHISDDTVSIGRHEAYLRMMKKYDCPVRPEWEIDCEWHRRICYDKTLRLMQLPDRPTAIFVASDHMAMSSMAAVHELKLSIPGDVSIIGISDIDASKYLNPPLTTVAIPQNDIGEIAVDTLLQRMNGNNTLPKEIFVPTRLVVRSSVRNLTI